MEEEKNTQPEKEQEQEQGQTQEQETTLSEEEQAKMIKKAEKAKRKYDRYLGMVKFFSFFGLGFSAILFALSWFLSSKVSAVIELIAKVFLFIAIIGPSFEFVKNKKKGWKIVYAIIVVIYITGCTLGILKGLEIIK